MDISWSDSIHRAGSMGSDRNLAISLQSIRLATNNFSAAMKLGEGGEATVFRGVSPSGGKPWAVKRLKEGADPKYFIREVETIAGRRHAHVVELLYYCEEEGERVLVYEFMDKGSLRCLLQRQKEGSDPFLTFDQRIAIAEGAAEGIRYLHESLDILHRDVKTDNILITDKFVAKLADFGTVQEGNDGHTLRVPFTIGYVAPECISLRQYTKKADVYSFGVVLLELLSGKRAVVDEIDKTGKEKRSSLADWALKHAKDLQSLVDPLIWTSTIPLLGENIFRLVADLALHCIHKNDEKRPDMKKVVRVLGHISSMIDEEEEMRKEKEKGEEGEEEGDVARMSLAEELKFAMNEFSDEEESTGGKGPRMKLSSNLVSSLQSLGLESSMSGGSSMGYSERTSDTSNSVPEGGGEVAEKLPVVQPQIHIQDRELVQQMTRPPPPPPQPPQPQPGIDLSLEKRGEQQAMPGVSFSQTHNLYGSGVETGGRMSMDLPPVHHSQTQGLVGVASRYEELPPVTLSHTQVMSSSHDQNYVPRSTHEGTGGSFSQAQGGGSFLGSNQRGYGETPADQARGGGMGWQSAGVGVGEDVDHHRAAFDRHREAAGSGNVEAKFNMAACLELGWGVGRDMRQALVLYHECARFGNWRAKYNLGLCYLHGKEVERDAGAAVRNFREASEAGSAEARYSLGVCHEMGDGVTQDLREAAKMYQWAAEGGYPGAGQELNRLHAKNGWLRNILW